MEWREICLDVSVPVSLCLGVRALRRMCSTFRLFPYILPVAQPNVCKLQREMFPLFNETLFLLVPKPYFLEALSPGAKTPARPCDSWGTRLHCDTCQTTPDNKRRCIELVSSRTRRNDQRQLPRCRAWRVQEGTEGGDLLTTRLA